MISVVDFANRPPVAFNGELPSHKDPMSTLSWLDQATCFQIYHMCVDTMVLSHQKYEATSHKYVNKVIAQKFNITPWRANAQASCGTLGGRSSQVCRQRERREEEIKENKFK
jgi:hypothetical protein